MQIFTEPGEWAYLVIRCGKWRLGWYHGYGNYHVWRVR